MFVHSFVTTASVGKWWPQLSPQRAKLVTSTCGSIRCREKWIKRSRSIDQSASEQSRFTITIPSPARCSWNWRCNANQQLALPDLLVAAAYAKFSTLSKSNSFGVGINADDYRGNCKRNSDF